MYRIIVLCVCIYMYISYLYSIKYQIALYIYIIFEHVSYIAVYRTIFTVPIDEVG